MKTATNYIKEAQGLLRRRKVFQNVTNEELELLAEYLAQNYYANGYVPLSNKEIAVIMGRDPEEIHVKRNINTKL